MDYILFNINSKASTIQSLRAITHYMHARHTVPKHNWLVQFEDAISAAIAIATSAEPVVVVLHFGRQ